MFTDYEKELLFRTPRKHIACNADRSPGAHKCVPVEFLKQDQQQNKDCLSFTNQLQTLMHQHIMSFRIGKKTPLSKRFSDYINLVTYYLLNKKEKN